MSPTSSPFLFRYSANPFLLGFRVFLYKSFFVFTHFQYYNMQCCFFLLSKMRIIYVSPVVLLLLLYSPFLQFSLFFPTAFPPLF